MIVKENQKKKRNNVLTMPALRSAKRIAPRTLMKMREKTRGVERKKQIVNPNTKRTHTGHLDKIHIIHSHISGLRHLSEYDSKSLRTFSKGTLENIKKQINDNIFFLEKQIHEISKSSENFSKSEHSGFNIMSADFETQKKKSLKATKEIDEIISNK